MKKETIKKIEEEITKKTTLTTEIKEIIKKDIFTNISIAILMIVYFTFLIMGSVGNTKATRTIDLNIFSIIFLSVSIYLFENSYRKNIGRIAIYGIEMLACAILTLFFSYIFFELDKFQNKYYMIVSIYIAIYYIIKSICIAVRIRNKYINQASDIKEIIKKEDIIKHKNENNVIEDIKELKKIDETLKENTPKKRGRPRKIQNEDVKTVSKSANNKSNSKSQANPKTNKNTPKESINKQQIEEQKPKKRGRPRKVVVTND